MTGIPTGILDLGAGVIIVFVVLLILKEIVKLVNLFKRSDNPSPAPASDGNGNGKRVPCVASPIIQELAKDQAMTVETNKRLEGILKQLSDNSIKQTYILEGVQKSQEAALKLLGVQSRLLGRLCTRLKLEDEETLANIGD